jgi:hypothetical protein
MRKFLVAVTFVAVFISGATCHRVPEDSASAFAAVAGEATMLLGGCEKPLRVGHESCLVEKGKPLPTLTLAFTNPAEYYVSDCNGGILVQSSIADAGIVDIDTTKLAAQLEKAELCFLEVEAREYFADPNYPKQRRMIPFIGGFFIRSVAPGYFPVPPPNLSAFCIRVDRTTKGRTTLKQVACGN